MNRKHPIYAMLAIAAATLITLGSCSGSGSSGALSAPSNVTVSRGSASDTVSWSPVSGAVKYRVYATTNPSAARQTDAGQTSLDGADDCACSDWIETTCSTAAADSALCHYCDTANTCAQYDHAPADTDIDYQVSCFDQANVESPRSEEADTSTGDGDAPSPAPAPGALPPEITLACVGVDHYNGYSVITVCSNFTNVSGADWNGVSASMGSTPPGSYSYTYSSELQEYLTKTCATFRITQYGSYSGFMGVSTSGGSAVVAWDITVTSAGQACQ